ncbi:MAG: YceI family protein [Gammaproteobacteria bacterium]
MRTRLLSFVAVLACAAMGTAIAAPQAYDLDPDHTHIAFEADHFAGFSVWRGLLPKNRGTATLDKAAQTGTVDVYTDLSSVEIGQAKLDDELKSDKFFNVAKYPESHYQGTLGNFVNGVPTTITGNLTLHGVTKPVNLKILSFRCQPHPFFKREACGADAIGTFNRDDFGIDYAKSYGFSMAVTLRIQVEGIVPK